MSEAKKQVHQPIRMKGVFFMYFIDFVDASAHNTAPSNNYELLSASIVEI